MERLISEEELDKEEIKNKISIALKGPTLQQGFEIICKNLTELEQENIELREKLEGAKKAQKQLVKAKEIIKNLSDTYEYVIQFKEYADREVITEANQFLKDVEKWQ